MYIFKKLPDENTNDTTIIQHEIETVQLGDLITAFENFVRGCGFVVSSRELRDTLFESLDNLYTQEENPDETQEDFQNISNAISCITDETERKVVSDEIGKVAVNSIGLSWDEWYNWCGVSVK